MSRTAIDLVSACEPWQQAVRAAGDYEQVVVRPERGHLMVYAGDEAPVARLTPVAHGHYGLHFYRHDGRGERMPFAGAISEMATTLIDTLGPYLVQAKL